MADVEMKTQIETKAKVETARGEGEPVIETETEIQVTEQTKILPQVVVEIKNHDSQLFNSCYDIIRGWITEDTVLDTKNILDFTVKVITLVQKMSRDKGPYKKKLVLDLIKRLVVEINYPNAELKKLVLEFIDATLPSFIDVTISVAVGQLNIGKRCRKLKKLCCCCC